MKALPWIIAGVSFGLAAFFVLNQPGPRYAAGNDDIENAADKMSLWGSKQRVSGTGQSVIGKIKKGIGQVAGDNDLAAEGAGEQVVGAVKDAAGQVAHAVGETIDDMNR